MAAENPSSHVLPPHSRLIQDGVCLYKTCDVRDPDACAAVVQYTLTQFGRVDILVNGAAGNFLSEAGH